MKTLQEIKDEVAFEYDWIDFVCFKADCDITDIEIVYDEIAKRYAKEVAKQALINASENARIIKSGNGGSFQDASVCKMSITDEKNIPNLD